MTPILLCTMSLVIAGKRTRTVLTPAGHVCIRTHDRCFERSVRWADAVRRSVYLLFDAVLFFELL
jgi:hypothetical protein